MPPTLRLDLGRGERTTTSKSLDQAQRIGPDLSKGDKNASPIKSNLVQSLLNFSSVKRNSRVEARERSECVPESAEGGESMSASPSGKSNTLTLASINLQSKWKTNVAAIEKLMLKQGVDVLLGQDHGNTERQINKGYLPVPDKLKFNTAWFGYDQNRSNKARTLAAIRNVSTERDSSVSMEPEGCWMEVELHARFELPVRILNVYVPQKENERKSYLDRILARVEESRASHLVIVAGDFNLVRDTEQDIMRNYNIAGEYGHTNPEFYERLEEHLTDSVKVMTDGSRFTRRGERVAKGGAKTILTRLDQIWVDNRIANRLLSHKVREFVIDSDHGVVTITLETMEHDVTQQIEAPEGRVVYKLPDKGSEKYKSMIRQITEEWEVKKSRVDQLVDWSVEGEEAEALSEMTTQLNDTIHRALVRHGHRKIVEKDPNRCNRTRKKIDERLSDKKKDKKNLSKGIGIAGMIDRAPSELRELLVKKLNQIHKRVGPKDKWGENPDWNRSTLNEWIYSADKRRRCLSREIRKMYREIETKEIENVIRDILDAEDTNRYLYFKRVRMRKGESIRALREQVGERFVVHTDKANIMRILTSFWRQVFSSRGAQPKITPEWLLRRKKPEWQGELLNDISVELVKVHIDHLSAGKAPGEDGVSAELLQMLPDTAVESLTKIFNDSLRTNKIPKQWKLSRISLIHKDGSAYEPGNYRPISLLSTEYKLFTKILADRLSAFMERNQFLSSDQLGYRENKDAIEGVARLIHQVRGAIKNKKKFHTVFIDFTKAYDSVEHWAIKQSLEYYGLPRAFINLVEDMLAEGKADIITEFGVTERFGVGSGVRQGDSISPILFVTFMNPLLEIITEKTDCKVTAYCDDVVITAESREELERAWQITTEFAAFNNMMVNARKSGYATNDPDRATLFTGHDGRHITELGEETSYKYLGVWVNLLLDWRTQINECEKKLKQTLDVISFKKMAIDQKIALVNIVIHNSIGYRMNVISFPKKWLVDMDNLIADRLLKLMGMRCSTKNRAALWSLRGLHKLENLQLAIFASTMVDRILNSDITKVDKEQVDTQAIQGWLRAANATLVDTSAKTFDLYSTLGSNEAGGISNRLLKCGIKELQQVVANDEVLSYKEMAEKYAEEHFKHRLKQEQWERVTEIIEETYQRTEAKRKVWPHLTQWPTEELEEDKQAGLLITRGREVWVWTDGSFKDGQAGSGVLISSDWWHGFRTEGEQTILNAELQAIEWALANTPKNWKLRIVSDSKNAIRAVEKFPKLPHIRRIKLKASDTLSRIEAMLTERTNAGGGLCMSHVYSHINEKHETAESQGEDAVRKWKEKLRQCKKRFGKDFALAREGNEKVDKIAELGRSNPQRFPTDWLEGTKRWVVEVAGRPIIGNLLKELKKVTRARDRDTLLADTSRFSWTSDETILKENLGEMFCPRNFRRDKVNNWWFKTITGNLNHASKLHHFRKPNDKDHLYTDNRCQLCLARGVEMKENVAHMMTCQSQEELDRLLARRVNKVINECSSVDIYPLETWFPCPGAGETYFRDFDRAKGALGHLPQTLGKYLTEVRKVPTKKVKDCVRRINKIVKHNRYIRFKHQREAERRSRVRDRNNRWEGEVDLRAIIKTEPQNRKRKAQATGKPAKKSMRATSSKKRIWSEQGDKRQSVKRQRRMEEWLEAVM
jgi:exonuclease III